MSLVTPSQQRLVKQIEQATKSKMNEGVMPTRRAIGAKRMVELFRRELVLPHLVALRSLTPLSYQISPASMRPRSARLPRYTG